MEEPQRTDCGGVFVCLCVDCVREIMSAEANMRLFLHSFVYNILNTAQGEACTGLLTCVYVYLSFSKKV